MLGGSVVKNPPASVGDTGLTPDLGRSHMPWCTYVNYARAPQPLSLCSRVQEPRLLRPHATTTKLMLHNKRSHCDEKPVHCNYRAASTRQLEKARAQQQGPRVAKNQIK